MATSIFPLTVAVSGISQVDVFHKGPGGLSGDDPSCLPEHACEKIPVYADGKLELEGQYMLCSDIQITPDSVEVYGIPAILDTITDFYRKFCL